jgi:hypothetical protein
MPTYLELGAEGERLRSRVRDLSPNPISTANLVDAIRRWQAVCDRAVAVRNPRILDSFRQETGPLQRLMGDGWMPKPGWRQELDAAIARWLAALEAVSRD